MRTEDQNSSHPKSMRQKRVLDAAADYPDASADELASVVPSATTDLVKRVLDEYGDPAAEEQAKHSESADNTTATQSEPADDSQTASTQEQGEKSTNGTASGEQYSGPAELTDKQQAVLKYVAMDPTATQREVGTHLGVTPATVSTRVNEIDGFDWAERAQFVRQLFTGEASATADGGVVEPEFDGADEGETTETTADSQPAATGETGEADQTAYSTVDAAIETAETKSAETSKPEASEETGEPVVDKHELAAQVDDISAKLDEIDDQVTVALSSESNQSDSTKSAVADPELVHKTVQCWLEDDRFSKSEEVTLLRTLFSS